MNMELKDPLKRQEEDKIFSVLLAMVWISLLNRGVKTGESNKHEVLNSLAT